MPVFSYNTFTQYTDKILNKIYSLSLYSLLESQK